jgi:uncharacterized protein (TIGR02757 family)
MINRDLVILLRNLANKYETEDFLKEDPSRFMHEVEGQKNQETIAFIASCLSYGSRKQFFPKIRYIIKCSKGDVYNWVLNNKFEKDIPDNDECYYRLYSNHMMNKFLHALSDMLAIYGSLGNYLKRNCLSARNFNSDEKATALECVEALSEFFTQKGVEVIVPKNTKSSCKRVCMFLRWMVRDKSPVDLGLWADFIDKKSLIMPLDTHVMQESRNLELTGSKTASMSTAIELSETMLEVFPDDPLRGDFALFGLGVNKGK